MPTNSRSRTQPFLCITEWPFFLLRDDEGAWPKVGRGGSIVYGAECVRGFWDERRMNVK